MKVVKIVKGGDYRMAIGSKDTFVDMKEGKGYVLNDPNAVTFYEANSFVRQIKLEPFEKYYKKYGGQDLDGKHLIAYRTGGAGDILFMTPGLKFLKQKYPTCKITVCTSKAYEDLVNDNPDVDEYLIIPTELEVFEKADYHILFEGLIEDSDMAEYYNAYDLFLIRMGILGQVQEFIEKENTDDKFLLPTVTVKEDKLGYVKDLFDDHNVDLESDIIIGFNPWSTTLLRNYVVKHSIDLVNKLVNKGIKVILLGGRGESDKADFLRNTVKDNKLKKNVVNLTYHCYDFGYTVAAIKLLDVLIGVDSACIHLAGGLEIPIIGIYGPFASKLRMAYYKNAIGLDGFLRCSPCFIHGPYPCRFNPRTGNSPCIELTDADLIMEQLDRLLKGTKDISIIGGE